MWSFVVIFLEYVTFTQNTWSSISIGIRQKFFHLQKEWHRKYQVSDRPSRNPFQLRVRRKHNTVWKLLAIYSIKYFHHNFISPLGASYVLTHFNTENLSYIFSMYVANRTDIFLHKNNDSKINSYYRQANAVDTYDKILRALFSKCFDNQPVIVTASFRTGPNVDSQCRWLIFYPFFWLYTFDYKDGL